jgi:hypothetical protein
MRDEAFSSPAASAETWRVSRACSNPRPGLLSVDQTFVLQENSRWNRGPAQRLVFGPGLSYYDYTPAAAIFKHMFEIIPSPVLPENQIAGIMAA